jgi:O-glycosyl hydrolase
MMIASFRILIPSFFAASAMLMATPCISEIAEVDDHGRVSSMSFEGYCLPIRTDLRFLLHNGKTVRGLDDMQNVKLSHAGSCSTWAGTLEDDGSNKLCRIQERITETNGVLDIALSMAMETDIETDGVYFWIDLPIKVFGGGVCDLAVAKSYQGGAIMPVEQPAARHILVSKANSVDLADTNRSTMVSIRTENTYPVVLQDNREYESNTYSLFFLLKPGALAKGSVTSLHAALRFSNFAEHTPARLSIDPGKPLYKLDGFGGNYCFQIVSPVTQYTLNNLRVAWARTQMTLTDWTQAPDEHASIADTIRRWGEYDVVGSALRCEFLMAKQIQELGVPCVSSVWYLPDFTLADPGRGREVNGRRVAADRWPVMIDLITSYLLYAKQQYGIEPALFSFNEPDGGVHIRFSPEEHRDLMKRLGARMAELGLKTRMLLGDTAGARGTDAYIVPSLKDPEAMKYVGAVSFHSWGGATPDQYKAWKSAAMKAKQPLMITELGVDPYAWHTGLLFHTYDYGLREAAMYQQILLYAEPQATLYWEFTADYGLVNAQAGTNAEDVTFTQTPRFAFARHFCNLTPLRSDALATTSDNSNVLFTAFSRASKTENGAKDYSLHILNTGASRAASVSGLPGNLQTLRVVQTTELQSFMQMPPATVQGGTIELQLPAESMTTLTTLSAE